jgi:hypothetical protein
MPDRAFSTEDVLRTGWNRTMANLRPLLGLGAVSAVLVLLQSALREPGGGPPGLRGLFSLAINVVQVGLSMVWIRTALRLREGRPPDLAQWRDVLPRFFSYLLASVLVGLVVAVGLVLLVVPGVIWGLTFGLAGFAVMDQGLDPLEAMRESRRLTDGVKGQVLVFALARFPPRSSRRRRSTSACGPGPGSAWDRRSSRASGSRSKVTREATTATRSHREAQGPFEERGEAREGPQHRAAERGAAGDPHEEAGEGGVAAEEARVGPGVGVERPRIVGAGEGGREPGPEGAGALEGEREPLPGDGVDVARRVAHEDEPALHDPPRPPQERAGAAELGVGLRVPHRLQERARRPSKVGRVSSRASKRKATPQRSPPTGVT